MRAHRALARSRRLPVVLALAALIAVVPVGGAAAVPLPAGVASTEAPEEEPGGAPEEGTAPATPQTDEDADDGVTEGDGPQPVVWFLAAAALLAMAIGFVILTRNQHTRG